MAWNDEVNNARSRVLSLYTEARKDALTAEEATALLGIEIRHRTWVPGTAAKLKRIAGGTK